MDYYNTFQKKRIRIWGHRTNSLSGGPNLTLPLYVSCINQFKKFRNYHFGRFDDAKFTGMKQFNIKILNKRSKKTH